MAKNISSKLFCINFNYYTVPTPPQDFELLANSNTGSISILQWKQPVYLFGTLIHYNILMSTSNDTSLAKVVFMTNDTTFDLSILDIEEGSYYVWVSSCIW